jgi:hypothetical protein
MRCGLIDFGSIKGTMTRLHKSILIFLGVASTTLALWLCLKQFYYDPGAYRLGVRNATSDTTVRQVTLRLEPRGQFDHGIIDPGQVSWDMDPRTPTPTNIIVSFADLSGAIHTLSTTGAPPKFRGSICVVITKTHDYAAHLELERQQ